MSTHWLTALAAITAMALRVPALHRPIGYCRIIDFEASIMPMQVTRGVHVPRIEIEYCTQCRWLLRAAWMAQELLTTFSEELGEVALVPGTGGVFDIRVDETLIWSRTETGRFPDIKQLKQLVRDRVAPTKDLGHSERPTDGSS